MEGPISNIKFPQEQTSTTRASTSATEDSPHQDRHEANKQADDDETIWPLLQDGQGRSGAGTMPPYHNTDNNCSSSPSVESDDPFAIDKGFKSQWTYECLSNETQPITFQFQNLSIPTNIPISSAASYQQGYGAHSADFDTIEDLPPHSCNRQHPCERYNDIRFSKNGTIAENPLPEVKEWTDDNNDLAFIGAHMDVHFESADTSLYHPAQELNIAGIVNGNCSSI